MPFVKFLITSFVDEFLNENLPEGKEFSLNVNCNGNLESSVCQDLQQAQVPLQKTESDAQGNTF